MQKTGVHISLGDVPPTNHNSLQDHLVTRVAKTMGIANEPTQQGLAGWPTAPPTPFVPERVHRPPETRAQIVQAPDAHFNNLRAVEGRQHTHTISHGYHSIYTSSSQVVSEPIYEGMGGGPRQGEEFQS